MAMFNGGFDSEALAAPAQSLAAQPVDIPTQIAPRGGMFGSPNAQMAIMAAISGLMARRHPQVSQMMQGLLQNRLAQQDFERRRQQTLQDQMALYDYKAAHPEAPAPSEFAKILNERGIQQGSPEWNKAYDNYIQYRESPDQLVNVPGVGLVQVPRNGAPQGPPKAPVGKLTPLGAGGPGLGGPGGFPY